MTAKQRYAQLMEWLYIFCIVVAGIAMTVMTLIVPVGVFMRYAMNDPLSWPEPAAIVLMVIFSFIGGAGVYRANVHVAVQVVINAVNPRVRSAMLHMVDACMGATALFMVVYGIHLCQITQYSTVAEFPWLSVAYGYSPIPISGAITLLFLFERVWVGSPPPTSIMYRDQSVELE